MKTITTILQTLTPVMVVLLVLDVLACAAFAWLFSRFVVLMLKKLALFIIGHQNDDLEDLYD